MEENVFVEKPPAARSVVEDDGKNRHGFPRGYHFAPKPIELIGVLNDKRAGRRLPYPPNIFHDVRILDYHPADLYDAYKADEEAGFIYFFSRREFPEPRGARMHPVRAAKGGSWRASGGGKPVKRGGVNVGYDNTLAFYQKKKNTSALTDWGLHEYTTIIGPDKKVADLALYRLYKKNKSEAGEQVSNGSSKLEELPSPCPTAVGGTSMASISQAQAQATVGQAHGCYHQNGFGATASAPRPSSWVTLTAADPPMGLTGSPTAPLMAPSLQVSTVNCSPTTSPQQQATSPMSPQHQAIDHYDLAGWDNMLLLPSPVAPSTESGPAAIADDLPTSQQQDAEYPGPADSNELLMMLQPPTLPAPDSQGYLDDEFKVSYEMQQKQPALSTCWFPMPGDHDLPMLTDERNQLYASTLDELLAGLPNQAAMSTELTSCERSASE